jgi:nucleoside-diphosphate-sugar epimerase
MTQRILVTGGAGFIGSHTCVALAAAGYIAGDPGQPRQQRCEGAGALATHHRQCAKASSKAMFATAPCSTGVPRRIEIARVIHFAA